MLHSRRRGSLQRDSRDGRQAELLGLRWAGNGTYRVEVVYSGAGQPKHPISGTVLVKAHGKTKIIPFVLSERSRPLVKLKLQRRRKVRHYYR